MTTVKEKQTEQKRTHQKRPTNQQEVKISFEKIRTRLKQNIQQQVSNREIFCQI